MATSGCCGGHVVVGKPQAVEGCTTTGRGGSMRLLFGPTKKQIEVAQPWELSTIFRVKKNTHDPQPFCTSSCLLVYNVRTQPTAAIHSCRTRFQTRQTL